MPLSWQLEVAVMLSQLGCIVLTAENNEKLHYGRPLTQVEAESTQCAPKIALQLLANIPRLEMVCAILDAQEYNFDGSGAPAGAPQGEAIPLGARILKVVTDYDFLEAGGTQAAIAVSTMQNRKGRYDPKILAALGRVKGKAASGIVQIKLADLQAGMLLIQDVVSNAGDVLVPRGHETTPAILSRLSNLAPGSVHEPLTVYMS